MAKTPPRAPSPKTPQKSHHHEGPAGAEELTDTQRRILTAALEIFSEKGYDGASTAAIAARAGVAEKTLFAQFKSKSELLARTLRPSVFLLIEPRAIDRIREVVSAGGLSLEGLLTAVMQDRLELASTHRKKLKLIAHEVLLRPELFQGFHGTFQEWVAPLVARAVVDLASRGELRTDIPPRTLARTVVSTILGFAMSRYVLGLEPDVDDDEEIRRIVKVLVSGLKPREASVAARPKAKR